MDLVVFMVIAILSAFVVSVLLFARVISALSSVIERDKMARWYIYILSFSTMILAGVFAFYVIFINQSLSERAYASSAVGVGVALAVLAAAGIYSAKLRAAAAVKKWPWWVVMAILCAGLIPGIGFPLILVMALINFSYS